MSENLKTALYIVLCLVAPVVWGIVSARLYDFAEARRKHRQPTAPSPAPVESADMYEI
jgi:hypothetical protein